MCSIPNRYFINKTAHRILELSGGDFTNYLGNYDYYLLKKEQLAVNTPAASAAAPTEDTESKTDWKQQKEEQAQKRKKENDLKKCEQRIEKSEVKVWECRNCGHIMVGTKAPEVCPVCNHPQSYFEVHEENY